MHVNGKHYRTVWMEGKTVLMIDQTKLPFEFKIHACHNYIDSCIAIRTMITRGAGAIGATAGFAMAQVYLENDGDEDFFLKARKEIESTRPTARNLFFAVEKVFDAGRSGADHAVEMAQQLAEENIEEARMIGKYGNALIENGANIATHCNAGWLGFVDYGSALSPIYAAKAAGKKVFVYVDETRPRGQGARLTAWELKNEHIPHTIIPDNAAAYYMSKGKIDLMITGADRVAANGDVANKIGTLEKAIIANRYGIPFYVAAPLSTFDIDCPNGDKIPIEQRDESEVFFQEGPDDSGMIRKIRVSNPGSDALNPAFDITPAELISGLITEKGIVKPGNEFISKLFT
ncbi:MAG: S-methyl-5-thioribose-1-phosphate isomerase [Bacteroidales bacterium]|nr:S-methyl-5-thioribose-1-phosphate isomerase [Bacteroidales bacterium]